MKNNKIEYCEKTGKYRYSSEAKAMRAVQRYEEIRRCYYCPHCDGFHTTKIGTGLAIETGLIEPPKPKTYSSKHIQNEINRLQQIINKKNE